MMIPHLYFSKLVISRSYRTYREVEANKLKAGFHLPVSLVKQKKIMKG